MKRPTGVPGSQLATPGALGVTGDGTRRRSVGAGARHVNCPVTPPLLPLPLAVDPRATREVRSGPRLVRSSPLVAVSSLLWCLAAHAAPASKLEEAQRLVEDLDFEAALKVLDAAEKTEGNDRATLKEIYTLQGIAFGTLGKEAKTRDSFRKLLLIAPEATLPSDLPPRVRTPFFEAKDWVSTNGPLLAVPSAELSEGLVRSVKVLMQKDVLRLARSVRFHLKSGSADQTIDAPLASNQAVALVGKPAVTWWAEVLNERGGVLVELGSARQPRDDGVVAAAPVVTAAPPPSVELPAPVTGGGWRRPVGIAAVGAGAVAAGVGLILGVQASDARRRVTNADRDELGRVTSISQRDAQALETTSRSQAVIANVLFGVGGGLAAAGVVLIIIGPDSSPVVALSPAPGGVVLSGSF